VSQPAPPDPALQRLVWVLAAAVAALVVHELWQTLRDRKACRRRDRLLLTALAREVLIINGIASAITNDINREREMLREHGRWRLKPLMTLPISIYEIARDHLPNALLEEEDGFLQLIGLQTQCAFMNRLAEEQQRWKSPGAQGQSDQLDVIVQFHEPLGEAVTAVAGRCSRLLRTLDAAGRRVGGLDLKKIEPGQ
jgi:hypothetical protein